MLEQSFTAYHFNDIFQKERRKGNIRKEYFSPEYTALREEGHRLNEVIRELRNKKYKDWNKAEDTLFKDTKKAIKENRENLQIAESKWLEDIASRVNSPDYSITLNTITLAEKQGYTVPDTVDNLFVMKTLQSNLKNVFKVKQANRHQIMMQVKLLMNESTPKYIIRTDVHHFYESIPQDRLLEMIKGNTLLSKMSVRFIRQILYQYEDLKDPAEPKGLGLPRGVGVSAYLSEIYMRDLDEQIKHREEVVFYVRYVDDIFMVLSHLPQKTTIERYYEGLRKDFAKVGLALMDPNDPEQKKKMLLEDLFSRVKTGERPRKGFFTYLGYKLRWVMSAGEQGNKLITTFYLSEKKNEKIKKRIDKAFIHFQEKTKHSLKDAKHDLRDSLRFIAGNYRLTKSKNGIKAGVFYSNDLLSDGSSLNAYTYYLRNKKIKDYVYAEVLKGSPERDHYVESIDKMVKRFDFKKQWEERKTYTLTDKRIKQISQWLSEE